MIHLDATIEGDRELSRRLLITADGIDDFREPLTRIGDELLHTFDANFASRGSLFGGWAQRKSPAPWPLLERTGTMRRSFDKNVDKDMVKLWNSAPYFGFHQSNQPRSKLPRRVMMKIDNQRKEFIQKAFQEYIISVMRKGSNG
jgi:phage gpG-like protein